jgi:hypothetical protein
VKKLLTWLGLAVAVIWVIHDPATAAADIRQAIHAVTTLVSGL